MKSIAERFYHWWMLQMQNPMGSEIVDWLKAQPENVMECGKFGDRLIHKDDTGEAYLTKEGAIRIVRADGMSVAQSIGEWIADAEKRNSMR